MPPTIPCRLGRQRSLLLATMPLTAQQAKIPAPIPRLPVLGWSTLRGRRRSPMPCLLEHPGVQFTTSGRASILLALEMLDIRAGDRVLVPTYHCPTMVAPVVALGAQPLFYPISASGAPALDWIAAQDLRGVRALLAAHFFGLPQPMQRLRAWCDQHGIALIEDCAHALFGSSEGRPIGSWGDLAIASLTKFLPVPEGGCLTVNGRTLALPQQSAAGAVSQIKAAVDMVQVGTMFRRFRGLNTALGGLFTLLNAPRKTLRRSRQSEAEPASGSDSLEGFSIDMALSHRALTSAATWVARQSPRERIVEGRRDNFRRLLAAFAEHPHLRPLFRSLPDDCAPYVFPLWVDQPDPGYQALREAGVPLSRWDRPWHDVPSLAGDQGLAWSHHVLQLPCHQDLQAEEIAVLVEEISRVYAG